MTNIDKRLDRIESKIDDIHCILREGEGKIASNRTAITYMKYVVGLIISAIAYIFVIITQNRGG